MKALTLNILFFVLGSSLFAQTYTSQQDQFIQEAREAQFGKIYYAYNTAKTNVIYKQLKRHSGMDFPIIFGQTFQWGVAHAGGVIILDYSTIHKNSNILAFMFAHEWAHQAKGHLPNLYHPTPTTWAKRSPQKAKEDQCDRYAGKFLAKYGYSINTVYNFLNGLPSSNDHTHSSGQQRARIVKKAYNDYFGQQEWHTCNSCGGDGTKIQKQKCMACNGNGGAPCTYCYGNGGQYAQGRNQYGQWGRWWYPCQGCGGKKFFTCNSCYGKGSSNVKYTCNSCNGIGKKKY